MLRILSQKRKAKQYRTEAIEHFNTVLIPRQGIEVFEVCIRN
jgi:hypothetical protein